MYGTNYVQLPPKVHSTLYVPVPSDAVAENATLVEFEDEVYDIVSVLARHELFVPQKVKHSYSEFENFTLLGKTKRNAVS